MPDLRPFGTSGSRHDLSAIPPPGQSAPHYSPHLILSTTGAPFRAIRESHKMPRLRPFGTSRSRHDLSAIPPPGQSAPRYSPRRIGSTAGAPFFSPARQGWVIRQTNPSVLKGRDPEEDTPEQRDPRLLRESHKLPGLRPKKILQSFNQMHPDTLICIDISDHLSDMES